MQSFETGIRRAALINDLSCFGKCSLTVALPILSARGIEAVPLPTAILSTHTGGFAGYRVQDMTACIRDFSAHWREIGLRFDCIYTGYICSIEQLEFVGRFIDEFSDERTLIVIDPVMGDNEKLYPIYDDAYVRAMRALVRRADVITPNRTEAALLTGLPFDSPDDALLAALDAGNAVITSAGDAEQIGYLARLNGAKVSVLYPRLDVSLHGAGDVFTSALAAELLNSDDPKTALRRAADFCNECIEETARRQPGHWYGLAIEPVLRRRMTKGEG